MKEEEEVVFLKLLLTVISCMTNLKFLGLVMILVVLAVWEST